jgi:hypothetical protein
MIGGKGQLSGIRNTFSRPKSKWEVWKSVRRRITQYEVCIIITDKSNNVLCRNISLVFHHEIKYRWYGIRKNILVVVHGYNK